MLILFLACAEDPTGPPAEPDPPAPGFPPPTTGDLRILVSTTGTALDPDGYVVVLDGGPTTAVAITDTVTIGSVLPGLRSVVLLGESDDCSVSGQNPRSVSIRAGQETTLRFDVSCAAPLSGQIVYWSSEGQMRLYSMSNDGRGRAPIGTVFGLSYPPSVSPDGRWIYYSDWTGGQAAVYAVKANGANPRRLVAGADPAVSPDGREIAFVNNGLFVMNADGTAVRRLVQSAEAYAPAWSPDGSRIVFNEFQWDGGSWYPAASVIRIINADGSGLDSLTTGHMDVAPVWSPDGSRIAFIRAAASGDFLEHVYLMRVDGSEVSQLTENARYTSARWSPDGSRLVAGRFAWNGASYDQDVVVIRVSDGATESVASSPPLRETGPTYSP